MEIISDQHSLQKITTQLRQNGKTIGFVPTMGALHKGHLQLVKESKSKNDVTIVSIFVNPIQFGAHEDLSKYPRPIENDQKLLRKEQVDYLFLPQAETIYPSGYQTHVSVNDLSTMLEGASRPGHYQGVTTVVLKLFNLSNATNAYFGQKDYQQCLVIQRMVQDLNLAVTVHMVPTVRDIDGLALSSRNIYLSPKERKQVIALNQSLLIAQKLVSNGETQAKGIKKEMNNHLRKFQLVKIDYIAVCDPHDLTEVTTIPKHVVILVASHVGKTRLIDNIIVKI